MGQQKPQEKPKKTILNGLTRDSSHRIGFLVFFGFPRVFGQLGLGQQKPREKPKNTKKKTILNGLTQDSSYRIVFVGFDIDLGILAMEKNKEEKHMKKQNVQKPNAPSVGFCMRVAENPCYFLHG